jgi:hypothetical protein
MPSLNRTLPRSRWLAALSVCFALASAILPHVAFAQSDTNEMATPEYLAPQRFTADQMPPADAAVVQAKQKEIAREAAFFGYDLSSGKWNYDELLCPQIPEDLLLHYRSTSSKGAESLFTALVPRGSGRVQVVPVLYRNAMPFHSAVESERTMAVFNRAIPAQTAKSAMAADGSWLELGVCYAELAGAEPRVPQRTPQDPGLVKAPLPTLHIAEDDPNNEIVFTDRDAPGGYRVWTIFVNRKGRVTAAHTVSLADYVGHSPTVQEPREKIMPESAEPREKPMPEGQQPPVVPKPQ